MPISILKRMFRVIRENIRYLREYSSIQETRKLLLMNRIFCFWGHLGEAYMAALVMHALPDKGNRVILLAEEQIYAKAVFDLFPENKSYVIVNNRARKCIVKEFRNEKNFLNLDIYTELCELTKSDNMIEAFKKRLNIPTEKFLKPFIYGNNEKTISAQDLLKNLRLPLNKTVLICPEAESIILVGETQEFWIRLADGLAKKGFAVVFNSRSVFANYQSVFLPIAETICFSQLCGYVIGKRSGLLDILAGTTDIFIEAIYPVFTKTNQVSYDFNARYFSFSEEKAAEANYLEAASLKALRNDGKIIELIWRKESDAFVDLFVSNIALNH